jgi:cysteine desulfurase/selenocysteine lyase
MGTGVVWGRRELLEAMPPYHVGSNMAHDVDFEGANYEHAALKFQAGTPDVAGPVGLAAAAQFLEAAGPLLQTHDEELVRHGLSSLAEVRGVRILGPREADRRVPVFSFVVDGKAPLSIARELDARGIAVRAGDLAALPLLKRFGATEAVRASAYVYNTTEDLDRLVEALAELSS